VALILFNTRLYNLGPWALGLGMKSASATTFFVSAFFHVHRIIFGRCERLMPEFLRQGRQWNPGVVTSATPVLRSFCNSQWNLALALVARALQIPKQVLIRFPVAVGEEILGLGVLSALVDCSGEAGADFHRAGFVPLAIGCSKEAVGCDAEIKVSFSTPFYAIACLPRHQILHCSWQNDFGQGFPLAIRGLGFTALSRNS
jgi:hypothetical protein